MFTRTVQVFLLAVALVALAPAARAQATAADTVIGTGTAGSCIATALAAAIAAGGSVSFDCGAGPVTIAGGPYTVTGDVTIDGGGLVTLSGENAHRLFHVQTGGSLRLTNLTLTDGSAVDGAGSILNQGALALDTVTIRNSRTTGAGSGGGALGNLDGTVTILNSRLIDNEAAYTGGAISLQYGSTLIENSTIDGNRAQAFGAIDGAGDLTIRNSMIRGNRATAGSGGAIGVLQGTTLIEGSLIEGNYSVEAGGGLYISPNYPGTAVTVRDSRIEFNEADSATAGSLGGGLFSGARLTLERVTVAGNSANGAGGLFQYGNEGLLIVSDSTFSNNSALGVGGALWLGGALGHQFTNVTVSGNTAGDWGGGLYVVDYPTELHHVTLFGNSAPLGANLFNVRTTVSLGKTLIGNPLGGGPNCSEELTDQPIISTGYNAGDDDSCTLTGPGDLSDVDLLLDTLADNGGPTQTHLPQAGSPAVDGAPAGTCPLADQRGYLRPAAELCDLGAVELGGVAPAPAETPAPLAPVILPGVTAPTIQVNPASGDSRTVIALAGTAAGTTVRISAVQEGGTLAVGELPVTGGSFGGQLSFPPTLAVGPLQLCAQVTGQGDNPLGCTTFTVLAAPRAGLAGALQLPSGQTASGVVALFSQAGTLAYQAQVQPNGAFSLAGIRPGAYRYVFGGQAPGPVAGGVVTLQPATQYRLDLPVNQLQINCALLSPAHIALVYDQEPTVTIAEYEQSGIIDTISRLVLRPGLQAAEAQEAMATAAAAEAAARDWFGWYVAGVARPLSFYAVPQSNVQPAQIRFQVVAPGGQVIEAKTLPKGLLNTKFTFDAARLPAGSGDKQPQLWVTPLGNGVNECTAKYNLFTTAAPTADKRFQPGSATWWAGERYEFKGTVPYLPPLVPFNFRVPPAPLSVPWFDHWENQINLGVTMEGSIASNGEVKIRSYRPGARIKLLDNDIIPQSFQDKYLNQTLSLEGLRNYAIRLPTIPVLPRKEFGIPFVRTPIFSFFALIDLAVAFSASFAAEVKLDGAIYPFRPDATMELLTSGEAKGEYGISIPVLSGVAEGGASLGFGAIVNIPLKVQFSRQPPVSVAACVGLRTFIHMWVETLWGFGPGDETTIDLASYWPPCIEFATAAGALPPISAPEYMARPAIATAGDGRTLSVYIEPNLAGDGTQVMAAFQVGDAWGEATALSAPNHFATNPVVAFAGPAQMPVVAWVEKPYDRAVALALGATLTDVNRHLNRQEIFYSSFANGSWSAPVRLTDDLLADGMPQVAGNLNTALLAWTRDTDGDAGTKGDQRVAVAYFDPGSQGFGELTLLAGGQQGSNNDVAVAWDNRQTPPAAYVAWVHDADALLATADDRKLAVFQNAGAGWVSVNPQPLPPRVDSPALVVGDDGVRVAFLVRQAAADGVVPVMGRNGALWSALYANGAWSAAPVTDGEGGAVIAEQPELAANGQEALLLYRRFGEPGSHAFYGQLALNRVTGQSIAFGTPVYVTDKAAQVWQPVFSINPVTQRAVVLQVTRAIGGLSAAETANLTDIAATAGVMATESMTLSFADDPVESLALSAGADPAVSQLSVSATAPAAGHPVSFSVVVRNVGRSAAANMTVTLHRGTPGASVAVAGQSLAGPLALGAEQLVTLATAATGSRQPYFVELTTAGGNASVANDRAGTVVGVLSAPVMLGVFESGLVEDSLALSWQMAAGEEPQGYRILRAPGEAGNYEGVGESSVTAFTDSSTDRALLYCYKVQAYQGSTVSPLSEPLCGELAPLRLFLPLADR